MLWLNYLKLSDKVANFCTDNRPVVQQSGLDVTNICRINKQIQFAHKNKIISISKCSILKTHHRKKELAVAKLSALLTQLIKYVVVLKSK